MTVAELIKQLQSYPPQCQVAYEKYSDMVLMEPSEVHLSKQSAARDDGWIHRYRDDKPSEIYVMFPGN